MFKLVNINDHPTNFNKKVFFFYKKDLADYFEKLLLENHILYEKQVDETGDQCIYIGVRKPDFKRAQHLNYLSHGKFRKPMLGNSWNKYILVFLVLAAILLAIIGALLSN